MNKRKLLVAAMSIMMVAILAVGGTMAYFTHEEVADNVFTIGNVEIELIEDFKQESNLLPGNDVNKDVWVKNIGSNDSYVRVHIAFPAKMDDGNPEFAAVNNFLHWNFTLASVADGQWSWLPEYTEGQGYRGNGAGNWNFYEETIDGELYNVYVATYRTALKYGEETPIALDKVYLDKSVNAVANRNEDGKVISYTYTDTHGNTFTLPVDGEGKFASFEIKVAAEGTQTGNFANAFDALNTAFGVPGTYKAFN